MIRIQGCLNSYLFSGHNVASWVLTKVQWGFTCFTDTNMYKVQSDFFLLLILNNKIQRFSDIWLKIYISNI